MTDSQKYINITGTPKSEKLLAASGTIGSMISGLGGNDTLVGSKYADLLVASEGTDILYGNDGEDALYAIGGGHRLFGGDGNDLLFASEFTGALLDGGAGNDRINLYFSANSKTATAIGGSGSDAFNIQLAYGEQVNGRAVLSDFQIGRDSLTIGGTAVDLRSESDLFSLSNSNAGLVVGIDGTNAELLLPKVTTKMLGVHVEGGTWDVLDGTGKDDRITGSWMDVDGERLGRIRSIDARGGDDHVSGSSFAERIQGGIGNDTIMGNGGNDLIQGGAGNDRLYGGTGRDTLAGNEGDDVIVAGTGGGAVSGDAGNDSLYVGGATTGTTFELTGGDGADRFIFRSGASDSVITDFDLGVDSLIINGQTLDINADLAHVATEAGIQIELDGHSILLEGVYL